MAKSSNIRTIKIGMLFDRGNFSGVLKGVVKDFQWGMKQLAIAGLAASAVQSAFSGLVSAISGPLKLAAANEAAAVSFSVLLGSADKAKKMIADLKAYGAATPFEFTDLQDAAKTLLSFGVAAESVMPSLDQLANVAQGDANKLKSLALVFGQVSANSKLTGGDLLQFINVGWNPLNEIIKVTGETMGEVRDRMSKGEVSFREVAAALKAATSEGGLFYQMNDKQGKTLLGLWSGLQDNISNFLADIGDAIAKAFDLKKVTADMTSFVQNMSATLIPTIVSGLQTVADLGKGLSQLGETIVGLTPTIAGLSGAALGAYTMMKTITVATWLWNTASVALLGSVQGVTLANIAQMAANTGYVVLTTGMTVAQNLFTASTWKNVAAQTALLLLSPKGWAILAGAAIAGGVAYYAVSKAMKSSQEEADKLANSQNDLAAKTSEATKANDAAAKAAEQLAIKNEAAAKAAAELKKKQEELNKEAKDLVTSLEDEIRYFGLTSEQAKIAKLADEGANQELVNKARHLQAVLDNMNAVKDAAEAQRKAEEDAAKAAKQAAEDQIKSLKDRAKALYEDTRTPLEKYEEKIAEIRKLMNTRDEKGNFILDKDTAKRAAEKAKAELDQETNKDSGNQNKQEGSRFGALALAGSNEAYQQIISHAFGENGNPQKELNKTAKQQLTEAKRNATAAEKQIEYLEKLVKKEEKKKANLPS